MSVTTRPRHRGAEQTGGAAGNERLTAMTGLVLLLLLAAEGITIVSVHQLITLHFFIGMLILGPVALKIGSTGYRFVRYYTRAEPYVRRGPPAPLLRLLGPVVIGTSLGVLGSGVALALTGPQHDGAWLLAHKAFFVLWFGAMTIHVLWYAPRLPRLLAARPAGRALRVLAGARARYLLLAASLAGGIILALLTVHLAGAWNPGSFPGR